MGKINLQATRATRAYSEVLNRGYDELTSWAVVHHRCVPASLSKDSEGMTQLLIDYVQSCFDRRLSLAVGRRAVLAVQHRHRRLVGELRGAWDSISSWQQHRPGTLRVPCPEVIAQGIFATALLKGFWLEPEKAQQWISFGILVWVAWCGLLRPVEAVNLRGRDVVLPSLLVSALENKTILSIKKPKNRRSLGIEQVSQVDDALSTRWLRWLVDGLPPELKSFSGSTATFRKLFSECCTELGIAHLKLTPASLRAGGATHQFVGGMETGRLRILGRWRCLKSLDHYVQIASSALTLIKVSDESHCLLASLKKRASVFDLPPREPWTFFFDRRLQVEARKRWISNGLQRQSRRPRPTLQLVGR